MLLLLCMTASAEVTTKDISADASLAFSLSRVKVLTPPDTDEYRAYYVQQGCCTDGTYAYAILENQVIDRCSIWKMDMSDWSVVKTEYALQLDHGNDITYHAGWNQLVVAHNKPNYTRLSFVDPETLQVVATREMPVKMYAISYEPTRDQFVIGISNTYNFVVTDGELNVLGWYRGEDTGLIKQNIDTDENYIYFSQWNNKSDKNFVQVYDWEGNFITSIRVKGYQEIESVFHAGEKWYIAFYARGSHIYEARLEYDSKKVYQSTLDQ